MTMVEGISSYNSATYFNIFANGLNRVAAFGQAAGYVGMAVGLQTWCHQKLHNLTENDNSTLPSLNYFSEYKQLLELTRVILIIDIYDSLDC
jgi:hypothetical protein